MLERMPFPYTSEYLLPQFSTQHKAAVFIEEYKEDGHIKRCTDVDIRAFPNGLGIVTYGPYCEKDSFDAGRSHVRHGRLYQFRGCPEGCRMYQAAWWGKPARWLKQQWWPFRSFVGGTAQWYASLHSSTQAIIAIAFAITLLALVGIPWREPLLDLIKRLPSAK